MSAPITLVCSSCSASFDASLASVRCPCGGTLDWRPASFVAVEPGSGIWRHARDLPAFPAAHRVTLGEPITPVVELGSALAKLEYLLPTGSFKDRGSALVTTWLTHVAARRAVIDSSGNAGASLAGYLAAARIPVSVFIPAGTSPGKLAQLTAYGADVHEVAGTRDDVTNACLAYSAKHDAVYASHQWSPFFVAGTATSAYELADQAPEVTSVVIPVGAGTLLLGVYDGYRRLIASGRAKRMPRLFAVQADAFAPLAAGSSWVGGSTTMAEGVRVGNPPRRAQVLEALASTGGAVLTASEAEIFDAWQSLARSGFYVEPTSALALAGITAARARGILDGSERPVMLLTGSGLKLGGEAVQRPPAD